MTLNESQQNDLARKIQGGVPLEEQPFLVLARELELPAEAILAQLKAWDEEGKLREISAVLEGSVLGYDSALVAGTVPEEEIDRVAEVINAHPTVTHNYVRNHPFNLWFTISVPPEQGLEKTLELLAMEAGVERFHPLRRTRTFKIGVNFDLKKRQSLTATATTKASNPEQQFGERERRMLRALQTPLPLVQRPFDALIEAGSFGSDFTSAELLQLASQQMRRAVRRYVATFRHRKLGVRGNGMAVWNIPDAQAEELGLHMAAAPEVSHCYARNAIDGFPYTVYSMIHGPDQDSVLGVAARMSREIGIDDYRVLFSTRELKKTRLRYFLPELDQWWSAHQREECRS